MIKSLKRNSALYRLYFSKTEVQQLLLVSCLFSISLSFIRVLYTKELLFLSLIWNLFLAFVPLAVTTLLVEKSSWKGNNVRFSLVFVIWLFFIPNSFYIITDLFHLEQRMNVPLWYDLALIFSFAWNGLLLGILSVRQMEKIVQSKWSLPEHVFVYPVMFLNAFGIYLGRYLRYNSWDIVSNPLDLADDVVNLFFHPLRNRFEWSMIFCFSIFMTLFYLTVKRLSRELD